MYIFSLLSLPLSFLAVMAWTSRDSASAMHAFARGLLFGLPAVLLWIVLKPLSEPAWGSPLLVLSFLLRYWLLPFGLSTASYALAVGFAPLARGLEYERLFSYMAGSLSVFSVANGLASWGEPSRVYMLALPCMVAASALAYPVLLEEAAKDGMPDAIKPIALAVGGFAVASLGAALFFMRAQWLGFIVTLLYTAGAAFIGFRRLVR
ncbi:MAG: hypothetical protein CVV51_04880 [Spirochaetae bacterium HGW-Spirochaetae-7]|jgi:hypothetical protein|nr:MAG: hypothetical protein CVV51_04880 [Spirochaetae bacterium HGW-Spirochaetae-7]